MTALGVVLLQTLCCLGLGAAALKALKIDADLNAGEHWALSFATGFGILGWLIFPLGVAGYLSATPLTALLTAGALAAVLLRRPEGDFRKPRTDILGKALLTLIGIVAVFDLMEGIAPPADADTLPIISWSRSSSWKPGASSLYTSPSSAPCRSGFR